MTKRVRHGDMSSIPAPTIDSIQQRLTTYACELRYEALTAEAIHAAKVRVIDTLGALFGGFFGEPCRIARRVAEQMPDAGGATVIGTRMKTTPDMAAFANAIAARYVEMNDVYHGPGTHGHPSDVLTPVLAAAEHVQASGRDLITAVVLAYEVFCRFSDAITKGSFDITNYACLATATAAGKLFRLSPVQLAHCISMAVVPNAILAQVRKDAISMFKAAAAGHAGRAGVFAALLARAGMEGPHLPFEGKAGWCDHVAGSRFTLEKLGGEGEPFRIPDPSVKMRPACAGTISSCLAAEKIAPLANLNDVEGVTLELYRYAKDSVGTGAHKWNPTSRESADHSAPYVVAATLMDGTLTPRSFNDGHLKNPQLHALMQKIKVVENEEFTTAYARMPVEHRARVTVVTQKGDRLVGEAGGDAEDLGAPRTDAQIAQKFRALCEDTIGEKRAVAILDRLWHLEDMRNTAEIPPALSLE